MRPSNRRLTHSRLLLSLSSKIVTSSHNGNERTNGGREGRRRRRRQQHEAAAAVRRRRSPRVSPSPPTNPPYYSLYVAEWQTCIQTRISMGSTLLPTEMISCQNLPLKAVAKNRSVAGLPCRRRRRRCLRFLFRRCSFPCRTRSTTTTTTDGGKL